MRFYACPSYTCREMRTCFVYVMQHMYRSWTKSRSERSGLLRWLSVPLHHIQLPGKLHKHPILNLWVLTRVTIAYPSMVGHKSEQLQTSEVPRPDLVFWGVSGSFWDWIATKSCYKGRQSENQQITGQEDIKAGVLKELKDETAQTLSCGT